MQFSYKGKTVTTHAANMTREQIDMAVMYAKSNIGQIVYPWVTITECQMYKMQSELQRKGKYRMQTKHAVLEIFKDLHKSMTALVDDREGKTYFNEFSTSVYDEVSGKLARLYKIVAEKLANYGLKNDVGIIAHIFIAYNLVATTNKCYDTVLDVARQVYGINLFNVFFACCPNISIKWMEVIFKQFGLEPNNELVKRLARNKEINAVYQEIEHAALSDKVINNAAQAAVGVLSEETVNDLMNGMKRKFNG